MILNDVKKLRMTLGVLRRILREEAWMPGRWYPSTGEPVSDEEASRIGDPLGMDETDARMLGDNSGNGGIDPDEVVNDPIADHLRGDEEKTALGSPPDETIREDVDEEIRNFFLQEQDRTGDHDNDEEGTNEEPNDDADVSVAMNGPSAGVELASPSAASDDWAARAHELQRGFYASYDNVRDHTGTDDLSATWYRSPGRPAGEDGDPFRGPDPYAQLGFHPPKGSEDPTASPPAADGEEGSEASNAPEEPALKTSKTSELGANVSKKHEHRQR